MITFADEKRQYCQNLSVEHHENNKKFLFEPTNTR